MVDLIVATVDKIGTIMSEKVKCPFCQSDLGISRFSYSWGKLKCYTCGAGMDIWGKWRSPDGFTLSETRLANRLKALPSQASFGNLTACVDSFVFNGDSVKYSKIQHLDFVWKRTEVKKSLNYIPTGTEIHHVARLTIYIADGKTITQKAGAERPKLDVGSIITGARHLVSMMRSGMSAEQQCQELFIVSQIIHRATFEQRTAFYLDEITNNECFEYGKFTFYRNLTVTDGKKVFDLRKASIFQEPYSLIISQETRTMKEKLLGNTMEIPATLDRDAFYFVLKGLLRITKEA